MPRFTLKSGQFTEPIRTRQGYVILKVVQHVPGGVPQYKDVEQQVEQDYCDSKMMPAMREYLTKMREDAYVEVKPGYAGHGRQRQPTRAADFVLVVHAAFSQEEEEGGAHPVPRDDPHIPQQVAAGRRRRKSGLPPTPAKKEGEEEKALPEVATMKPGKKEKIRYGQAPTKTLPNGPDSQEETPTEDAGAVAQSAEPANPLEAAPAPEKKTRFADRARLPKQPKAKSFVKKDCDGSVGARCRRKWLTSRHSPHPSGWLAIRPPKRRRSHHDCRKDPAERQEEGRRRAAGNAGSGAPRRFRPFRARPLRRRRPLLLLSPSRSSCQFPARTGNKEFGPSALTPGRFHLWALLLKHH